MTQQWDLTGTAHAEAPSPSASYSRLQNHDIAGDREPALDTSGRQMPLSDAVSARNTGHAQSLDSTCWFMKWLRLLVCPGGDPVPRHNIAQSSPPVPRLSSAIRWGCISIERWIAPEPIGCRDDDRSRVLHSSRLCRDERVGQARRPRSATPVVLPWDLCVLWDEGCSFAHSASLP